MATAGPVVDVHSHAIPTEAVEEIERAPSRMMARVEQRDGKPWIVHDQGYAYPLLPEFTDTAEKLRAMDHKSVEISVISPPPPLFYYWADPDTAAGVARLVNDGIARMVTEDPGRLRGMATVPMHAPEAAVEELERVVSDHGFRAVEVGTSVEGRQLTDEAFRPVLEKAAELGVLVLAHPYYVGAKQGLEEYYLTNLLGNPWDSTVMIANVLLSGLLEEVPDLKLCVAHGGGFAPYQVGRLDHGHRVRPETKERTRVTPSKLLGRLYFDTITFNPQALRYLVDTVGADHVLLGTDAPFDMQDEEPMSTVEAIPHLTDAEREKITSATALALLGGEG